MLPRRNSISKGYPFVSAKGRLVSLLQLAPAKQRAAFVSLLQLAPAKQRAAFVSLV
jgi:hypothetical protein